jgi:hypothetical protein
MFFRKVALTASVLALYGCSTHQILSSRDLTASVQDCPNDCKVDIKAEAHWYGCKVTMPGEEDQIRVSSPNRVIVWKLPPKFEFCVAQGDGVRFKGETDGQFFDGWATEHENGQPPDTFGCKRHFRWADLKTTSGDKKYDYEIRFRHEQNQNGDWSVSGITCRIDPWVVNR